MPSTTPAPSRLGFPALSVSEAHRLNELIEEAAAGLDHALTEFRTLMLQRDLVALWNDEQGAFRPEFEPLATRYHDLQRAIRAISRHQVCEAVDLSTYVEAQR